MPEWLGLPAAGIAWGFALYVWLIAPRTLASRLLIAMLVIDGIAVISSYENGAVYLDRVLGIGLLGWWRIHQASDWAVMAVYLAFIGVTVSSPLARPLAGRRTRIALLTMGGLLAVAMLPLDLQSLESMQPPLYIAISVVLTWGFVAALHAWITAGDKASRARARAFTVAFGVRDTVWMVTFLNNALVAVGILQDTETKSQLVAFAYALAVIIYVPLVAYGMLRTQLFDIDLRIKRTLKRSTVAAAFVAVFFLISELAGLMLSNMLGNLLGILATTGLVFFLEPIQRAAERLSDAAMPRTRSTPEYEAYRKLQVYEAALRGALKQGDVEAGHRPVLEALASSLGVDPAVARQLERDLVTGNLPPRPISA